MDLLEKLKMFRDELDLLIKNEEEKRLKDFQSEVGKRFSLKIAEMETKSIERPRTNTSIEL